MKHLTDKVAVVTGGASGIGKALARRLLAEGMRVVIADVERGPLDRAAEELGAVGVVADVTSCESVQALADEVSRRFGGMHLLCSNAGVASTARLADMSLSDWEWLLGVNLWGTIHVIKAFLPLVNANPDGGHITITGSMAGLHVTPGMGGYTVSKFAVQALAETLAAELQEDGGKVGVTVLCPGPVSSKLGSSQRNRPGHLAGSALVDVDLESTEAGRGLHWLDPDAVAELLLRAVRRGDLYAFTHPEWASIVQERHARIAAAFAAVSDAGAPGDTGK